MAVIGSLSSQAPFAGYRGTVLAYGGRESVVVTERLSGQVEVGRKPARRADARDDERALLAALKRGESREILRFVDQHHGAMVRLARPYVGRLEVAEEVAQEAWMAFMRRLDDFEGRSSLRSWLFSILLNRARTCGVREGRMTAASQLADEIGEPSTEFLDHLFHGRDHPDCGGWAVPPRRWNVSPEDELLARERNERIDRAVDAIPEAQRLVFTLRDRQGLTTAEVAESLDRTPKWVRVVLHRARLAIRQALDEQLGGVDL